MVIGLTKKVVQKIKGEGLKTTIIDLYTLLYDKYYDKKYHIDTCSWVHNKDLDVNDDTKQHSTMYMGTKVVHLRKALKIINIPKGKVLIDIGSGKGRVLLVASEFGFREARGIEFSPKLCDIAKKNIEIYKAKKSPSTLFTVINADAASYQFKDDVDVFFLGNPFDGVILLKVIHNILGSLKRRPRNILIIYSNAASKRKFIEEQFHIKQFRELTIMNNNYLVYNI